MRLRTARKIADRLWYSEMRASECPWDQETLFYAWSRLHTEWRNRRSVTVEEDGRTSHGITDDYYRANRVDSMRIRMQHFLWGRYRADAPRNEDMERWVRRTWKPPQS